LRELWRKHFLSDKNGNNNTCAGNGGMKKVEQTRATFSAYTKLLWTMMMLSFNNSPVKMMLDNNGLHNLHFACQSNNGRSKFHLQCYYASIDMQLSMEEEVCKGVEIFNFFLIELWPRMENEPVYILLLAYLILLH
jgi:hypothetical protein